MNENHLGIFTEQEIKGIFESISHDRIGKRDSAMIEILYSAGIRRNELISLNLDDIDFRSCEILVRKGKGDKERLVPVGAGALEALREYIAVRKRFMKPGRDHDALFLSSHGWRINPETLSARIRQLKAKAGVTSKGICHVFRHSFATHTLTNGAPIHAIKRMLGHEHLSTTEMYIHIDKERLAEVHKCSHPKAMEAE